MRLPGDGDVILFVPLKAELLLQVWQNCRIFNAEGSTIWKVCEEAENSFEANWNSARLPLTPRPPLPPSMASKKQSKSGNKRERDAGMHTFRLYCIALL